MYSTKEIAMTKKTQKTIFDSNEFLAKTPIYDREGKSVMTAGQFNDWMEGGVLYSEADSIVRQVLGDEKYNKNSCQGDGIILVDCFLEHLGILPPFYPLK